MVKYKIAVDLGGCDNGQEVLAEGAIRALEIDPELGILLVGNMDVVGPVIEKMEYDRTRVEILHAPDVVTNYDNPMEAIFKRSESSLVKALRALGERDDVVGLINAGSTGALIAGSIRYVPAKQLKRPALAAILPAERGGFTCLVDTGANIDSTAAQLHEFARMGSDFMKEYYSIESPRIGLLSNGSEPTKGNKLVKETHALLRDDKELNFVGNIEGNNALSGDCDVLVADGFAGNQVFKNSEGIARRIITDIVKYAKKTGSQEIMKLVGYLMSVYDFGSLGGAIILGAGKPIIKARGNSNADSIRNTASMLVNMMKNKSLFDGHDAR